MQTQRTCLSVSTVMLLNMDRTATFYSMPSYAYGAGMPIFTGARRQRGGSIFGSLKNFFLPILKGFGKKVVKRGMHEGLGLAKDVVKDAFMFKNINDSVKQHGKKRALDLGKYAAEEGLSTLGNMVGSGRKRRKRQSLRKRKLGTKKSRPRRLTKKKKKRRPLRRHSRRRRRTAKALF